MRTGRHQRDPEPPITPGDVLHRAQRRAATVLALTARLGVTFGGPDWLVDFDPATTRRADP